jgi:hypothetical protein
MKMRQITFFVISISFLLTATLRADEPLLKPCIPQSEQLLVTGTMLTGIAYQIPQSQAASIPLTHFSTSQPAYALNHIKGEYGEKMMNNVFTKRTLKNAGGWSEITPFRRGNGTQGIDGLYFKVDKNGLPRDMLISDAKYGKATLRMTANGKQMSKTWIQSHLKETASGYRNLLDDISKSNIKQVGGAVRNNAKLLIRITTVPLNDKVSIDIWKTPSGEFNYFCTDKSVTPNLIKRQLDRSIKYIESAADGNAKYRPRLFSYRAEGKEHVFEISQLDDSGNKMLNRRIIRGEFSKLPVEYQNTIKSQAQRILHLQGKSKEVTRQLTNEICQDAQKFDQLVTNPKWNYIAGLDWQAVKLSGLIGSISIAIDIGMQLYETGKINVKRAAVTGGVVFGSTMAGNYAGTQVSLLLGRSSSLLSKVGGNLTGGAIGSVLFAGGLYLARQVDGKTALSLGTQGVIISTGFSVTSYLVAHGVLMYATTYGVTSSGVAIASLSGAAQTSAALAWLGGGSIAAGGSGVAGGLALLNAIPFYGTIAFAAIIAGNEIYKFTKHLTKEADSHRYLIGIINITRERVKTEKQREWLN